MIKYSFTLLGLYFVYYAGNIVYDLFIQKNKQVEIDQTEEFSIGDFAHSEAKAPQNIRIDDVEHLITPISFVKDDISAHNNFEESDIDDLRLKFEAEQELEDFNSNVSKEQLKAEDSVSEPIFKEVEKDNSLSKWHSMLNMAETSVHMVKNLKGQKVYHSIL